MTPQVATKDSSMYGNVFGGPERRSMQRGIIAVWVAVLAGTAWCAGPASGGEREAFAATWAATATFSPDGKLAAVSTAGESAVEVFDVSSGQRLRRLTEHAKPARGVAFSPDSRRVVTCAEDNTVLVYDVASGKRVLRFTPPEHPKFLAQGSPHYRFRPMRNMGEALGAGLVNVLDQSLVEPLRQRLSHVHCVVYSPDGKRILSGQFDGSVRLWDAASGRQLRQFCGPTQAYSNDVLPAISTAAFSADGRRIVVADHTGYVRIWNTSTGQQLTSFRADGQDAKSAQFSPDGKDVLTLGADRVARVWDAASGKHLHLLFPGESGALSAACFASDGRVLSLGADSTLRTWDAASGKETTNVALAPRFTSKSLLAVNLAGDTVLNSGWRGLQTRDVATGRVVRVLSSAESGEDN
jgi:WD40 repeat protein